MHLKFGRVPGFSSSKNFTKVSYVYNIEKISFNTLTLKRLGERDQFGPPTCGFSKNVSSKERVKPWFFVTFNIITSHIFPEIFIEISQVVQKT